MDRSSIILTLSFVFAACGTTASSPRAQLDAKSPATTPSLGINAVRVASSGTLAYQVALTDPHLLSVELSTRFELVVRRSEAPNKTLHRIDLGPPEYDVLDLVVSGDGTRAYVASAAGWVRGYKVTTGERLSEWRMGSSATALALSDDDSYLVIGTESGVLCLRRLGDSAQLQCVAAHPSRVSSLDIHSSQLTSGDWSGTVVRWSLPSLREIVRRAGTGYITDIATSANGGVLAVARNRRSPIRTPELNKDEKRSANVDADGHNTIELYSLPLDGNAKPIPLHGHRSVITALAWMGPDLISASWDRSVRIWNPQEIGTAREILKLDHLVSDVATARLGGAVAAAGWAIDDDDPSITVLRLLYPNP
ncbi:MAG: hypothetical protein GY811_11405 [Myxococcales bacterium]|nr:hypothetical protein [Myxococcales bacterium]